MAFFYKLPWSLFFFFSRRLRHYKIANTIFFSWQWGEILIQFFKLKAKMAQFYDCWKLCFNSQQSSCLNFLNTCSTGVSHYTLHLIYLFYVPTIVSPTTTPLISFPFLPPQHYSVSVRKGADLQWVLTRHGTASYGKSKQIPMY